METVQEYYQYLQRLAQTQYKKRQRDVQQEIQKAPPTSRRRVLVPGKSSSVTLTSDAPLTTTNEMNRENQYAEH